MKTRMILFMVAMVILVFLVGCAMPRKQVGPVPGKVPLWVENKLTKQRIYYDRNGNEISQPREEYSMSVMEPRPGWVPVDIQNPSLLGHNVCAFEGSTPVTLVPTSRINEWKFSRPPMDCFSIDRASSEMNWHNYKRIYLPRNQSFVIVSRTENAWGLGPVEKYILRTGADPYAVQYWQVTPTNPPAAAGGLVRLRENAARRFGDGPLIIEHVIDARIGQSIASKITDILYGR